ncbi:hypothetical protein B0H13DRAFT_1887656 [Mycena leptocephala]|nr:hypothetical protein B0H13DRAFT_1887656 [Mycena leptocephala]
MAELRGRCWSCVSVATSGSTLTCLANANTTEILQGFAVATAESDKSNAWPPVIDGPEGIIPDLPSVLLKRGQISRLPFIAGTVLDEETLLQLYPDVPALGWFSFQHRKWHLRPSSQFKRAAAIGHPQFSLKLAATHFRIIGDGNFQSQRRSWIETAANAGVATFGYLFTEPQSTAAPVLGVYLWQLRDTSPSSVQLSQIMSDYYISFVTSLTLNDGRGVARPQWTQFTPYKKLNGANLTMIPDTYRAGILSSFYGR